MRFESRTFWLAKDADETAQYQDAFAFDAEAGRAAIADGVSSTIFSGPWARLLTLATIADPPPLEDRAALQVWMAEKRLAWANGIDASKLTWYQRPKMADGAMTTLLWLELRATETNEDGLATRYQLQAFAIGDSCLFHLRHGELLYWFPLESSADFGLNPSVVGSVDRQADHLLEFKTRLSECLPGDLLVLATDAVALWAVERQESGEPVDWQRYWDLADDDWRDEIFAIRDAKQMRFDDSTLVLLRVVEERPAPVVNASEIIDQEVIAASTDVAMDEPTAALAQGSGEEQDVVDPMTLEMVSEPALGSLTEPVEPQEPLRFCAAIEEGMATLNEASGVDEKDAEKSKEASAGVPAEPDVDEGNAQDSPMY